jgi:hypothetical protein
MNTETWKPVVGWEGIYEVSDLGRVKRVAAGRGAIAGKVLADAKHRGGYRTIHLRFNGREDNLLVHRVVAMAFCKTDDSRTYVNHKNGNRCDNRADNLEWVTMSENHLHAFRELGRPLTGVAKTSKGTGNVKAKLADSDIAAIRLRYAAGGISQQRIASDYGVSQVTISLIIRNAIWTHVA